jgi:DNA processing protein
MSDESLLYTIALSRAENVGAITAKLLISYCGGAKEVFNASKKEILKIPGIGPLTYSYLKADGLLQRAEKEIKFAERNKIQILTYTNKSFPQRLKHFDSCPLLLFVKGDTDLNPPRTVGIIGTRKPTEYGKIQCEKLVEGLTHYGVTTVSGLAYGIDALSHKKSLDFNIPTIGVLGHGLDVIYPSANRDLAKKMLVNGALMTSFLSETRPDRENFPARNKIVAALSDVLVVVESGRSGGSMITATFANDYNKDVFAIPGKIGDQYSEGCNKLIKINKAHLMETVDDIAYIMRWEESNEAGIQGQLFIELNDDEQKIVDLINLSNEISIDELSYKLKLPPSKLASQLLTLEFKGVIKSLPGKKYIVI